MRMATMRMATEATKATELTAFCRLCRSSRWSPALLWGPCGCGRPPLRTQLHDSLLIELRHAPWVHRRYNSFSGCDRLSAACSHLDGDQSDISSSAGQIELDISIQYAYFYAVEKKHPML